MQIVEFASGTLRFLEHPPERARPDGFVWIFLERDALDADQPALQKAAQALGGSPLLDLHLKDLANAGHSTRYDYTSVYDLVVFRRLATEAEAPPPTAGPQGGPAPLASFAHISTRAVGFVVFDRLLVSVHPAGCFIARAFIERYLADAVQSEGAGNGSRSRLPTGAADLMLRMLNMMVDSYLELRRPLNAELDQWQRQLLAPRTRESDWAALLTARNALHQLEDLCEEQNDAVQEWLDAQREQPAAWLSQSETDALLARGRDVIEHIHRVTHHVRRMEQAAETAVQIHFSAVGHRTNEIMRTLTALTAIFLPLNLIAGIFGMNFEFVPVVHQAQGFWWTIATMAMIALVMVLVFWRKRYLARTGR